MGKFKEIFIEDLEIIIFTGSESEVQKIMDDLTEYDENHNYKLQRVDYYSYTKDFKTYIIAAKKEKEFKKLKPIFDKIIKGK